MEKSAAEWNIYTERQKNTSCFMFHANNRQPASHSIKWIWMDCSGRFLRCIVYICLFWLSAFCSFDFDALNFIYSFDSYPFTFHLPTPPHIQHTIYAHHCSQFLVTKTHFSPSFSFVNSEGMDTDIVIQINKWIQYRASLKFKSLNIFQINYAKYEWWRLFLDKSHSWTRI